MSLKTELQEIKFPVSKVDINALLDEYRNVPKIDPASESAKEDYAVVSKGYKEFVKARNAIEKTRKALKLPALEYGREVDAIAKEYKAAIAPKEQELLIQKKVFEDYEENLRIQKELEEQNNINAIRERIRKIKEMPMDAMEMTSSEIAYTIGSLKIPDAEAFGEFLSEAVDVYKKTMQRLEDIFEIKKKAEQAEELLKKAESEAKAKAEAEAKKFKEEREEFKRQKAEFERQKAEIQAAKEAEELAKAEAEAEELQDLDKDEAESKNTFTSEELEAIECIKSVCGYAFVAEAIFAAIKNNEIAHVYFNKDI